ncbi:hypothetical protein Ate01nite_50750 [Actinoplanes teichomyceticus]|nr:hypothetical protein Ate01nite_50750 [Actinoplanes teichomyceticus]
MSGRIEPSTTANRPETPLHSVLVPAPRWWYPLGVKPGRPVRTEDSGTAARHAPGADTAAGPDGGRLGAGPLARQTGSRSGRAELAGAAPAPPASSPIRAHHLATLRRRTLSST